MYIYNKIDIFLLFIYFSLLFVMVLNYESLFLLIGVFFIG